MSGHQAQSSDFPSARSARIAYLYNGAERQFGVANVQPMRAELPWAGWVGRRSTEFRMTPEPLVRYGSTYVQLAPANT
ncbi:MAG: hypothetical protein JWL72_3827 [Ilumatobacteraceae bacterium]|nr:hypothetical protein [Ilumatobacteraceae bacterium]